ncbi:MAG: NosD domain-containing protein [Phycisphaerales bacterium]
MSQAPLDRRLLLGVGVAGLAGAAVLARVAKGGPLNPPAGAVASTGRTLDEVYNKIPALGAGDGRIPLAGGQSAITISQPGSYVLTGNVLVTGGTGITIASHNVTLDLNGYTVGSTDVSGGSGITANGRPSLIIRGGTVRGFETGVDLNNADRAIIEDVWADGQRLSGIAVNGTPNNSFIAVRRCTVTRSGTGTTGLEVQPSHGIFLSAVRGVVEDCFVQDCVSNTPVPVTYGIYQQGGFPFMMQRNTVVSCPSGIRMNPTNMSVYRDNTVLNPTVAAYSVAPVVDGGGNVP